MCLHKAPPRSRPADRRWATKQRAAWRRSGLEQPKVAALEALGFMFDAEEAEWQVGCCC
jgi:hypothetical protein